jgi:hypothetical protein
MACLAILVDILILTTILVLANMVDFLIDMACVAYVFMAITFFVMAELVDFLIFLAIIFIIMANMVDFFMASMANIHSPIDEDA